MEIMTLLNTAELTALRTRFEKFEKGLQCAQFVGAMLNILEGSSELNKKELTIRLIELFDQVDVNDNKLMEWEEFSSFCIETGLRLGRGDDLNKKFIEDSTALDPVHHGGFISKMCYIKELQKLICCEGGHKSIKIYDPYHMGPDSIYASALETGQKFYRMNLVHELDLYTPENSSSNGNTTAIDCVYLPDFNVLCITSDDMTLSFWDMSIFSPNHNLNDNTKEEVVKKLGQIRFKQTMYHLCWHGATKTLYTSGSGSSIFAWKITVGVGSCSAKMYQTMNKHNEMITDLILVEEYRILISAALDKAVHIWGLNDNKWRGARFGHAMGVRSISYAGNGVVLSAGYDFDIFAWDISGASFEPLFVLGRDTPDQHDHSLCAVVADAESHFAYSVDTEGHVRWWDVRLDSSILDSERCLQAFGSDVCAAKSMRFHPRSMCIIPGRWGAGDPLLCIASDVVHFFKTKIIHATSIIPSAGHYNDTLMNFVAPIGHDLRVWSSVDGSLLEEYKNVVSSSISAMCFDDRQRKYIFGTVEGEISINNCVNGVRMKRAEMKHNSEVSALVYCRGDAVFISASWDHSIRVWNDLPVDRAELLREVKEAHTGDITCIDHSRNLSLIASGSSDGSLQTWDFESCIVEDPCPRRVADAEITAVKFIDPYPLVAAADSEGRIWLWACRISKGKCYGILSPKGDSSRRRSSNKASGVGITAMDIFYSPEGGRQISPGVHAGIHVLCVADSNGWVRCLNLSMVIRDLGLSIWPRHNDHNYFARSLCRRDMSHNGRGDYSKTQDPATTAKLTCQVMAKWQGHESSICDLRVYCSPKPTIVTTSSDCTIKLWTVGRSSSLCGAALGKIDTPNLHGADSKDWNFDANAEIRKQEKEIRAKKMLELVENLGDKVKGVMKDVETPQETYGLHTAAELSNSYKSLGGGKIEEPTPRTLSHRTRVVAQIFGCETFKKNAADIEWEATLKREELARKKYINEKKQAKINMLAKASPETRKLIEYQDLLEGEETYGPSLHQQASAPTLPSQDKSNWSIGSVNRQRLMYSQLYNEKDRTRTQGRKGGHISSGKKKWQPSAFLRKGLGLLRDEEMEDVVENTPVGGDKDDGKDSVVVVVRKKKRVTPRNPALWNATDLAKFMTRNGLSKYEDDIINMRIDTTRALELSPVDMDGEDGPLMSRGDAAKFVQLVRDLKYRIVKLEAKEKFLSMVNVSGTLSLDDFIASGIGNAKDFQSYDTDNSGDIDMKEFVRALKKEAGLYTNDDDDEVESCSDLNEEDPQEPETDEIANNNLPPLKVAGIK